MGLRMDKIRMKIKLEEKFRLGVLETKTGKPEIVWTCMCRGGLLNMEFPDRKKRGRPQKRLKEDMQMVGIPEEDAKDRVRWRETIFCGNT